MDLGTQPNRFAGHHTRAQTELERILALPVLDPDWVAPDMSYMFSRPGGSMRLRPIQSKVIYYALVYGGILAAIGVGHGKTLISLLACAALGAERPILLIPAGMRDDLAHQWSLYAKHWNLPRNLGGRIFSYDFLSDPRSTALLMNLRPDLIVCDEFQNLKDPKAVRTRRFNRFMRLSPETKLIVMTGTPTSRSVKDYAHGAAYALKGNCPVPMKYGELDIWSRALDVNRRGPDFRSQKMLGPLIRQFYGPVDLDNMEGNEARAAFYRRLVSAPGVVATNEQSCDAAITIQKLRPEVPPLLREWLTYVDKTWKTPSGEEIRDALHFNRIMRQLSQGFFYRWVWPNGPDVDWIETRAAYHKALRQWYPRSRPEFDSRALCERAMARNPADLPAYLVEAYSKWVPHKKKPKPPTETVWIDPFLVNHALAYVRSRPSPVLVWFEHDAIGAAIASTGGFPFLPGGQGSNAFLAEIASGAREPVTACVSIDAHGTGKNLQAYRENLTVCPPASGAIWDQKLGRTHRQGQTADLIRDAVYVHTETFSNALRGAMEGATYIQETWGTPQKLCFATFEN